MNKALEKWEQATTELAIEFVKKYHGEQALKDMRFVGDEIGDVLDVNCEFHDLHRITDALRYEATKEQFFEYHDKEHEAILKNERLKVSFRNFVKYGWVE